MISKIQELCYDYVVGDLCEKEKLDINDNNDSYNNNKHDR